MSNVDLRNHGIKADALQHEILKCLKLATMNSKDLYAALPPKSVRLMSVAELVTEVTSVMVVEGHLAYENSEWSLTQKGHTVLNYLSWKPPAPAELTVAAKKSYTVAQGSYDGAELRDTCLRKGAYDFLALPSLYGTTSVPHRTASVYLGEMQ
jgi:hypothetical protein